MSSVLSGRRLIAAGAVVTALGVALSGTVSARAGYVVLAGWALLVYGLHRFGRGSVD